MNTVVSPIFDLTPEMRTGDDHMLIFDFDGVLINSLNEVTLTVYNAATGRAVTCLSDLPASLVGLFQRHRYHVQAIGDAILLMGWCLQHYRGAPLDRMNLKEYKTLLSGAEDSTAERTRRIYESRKRFIETDPACWLALHQPYQPLWDALVRRPDYPVVILTHKNRDAILRLCRNFGLSKERIDVYSGDNGASKTDNMQRIETRYRCGRYHYLDDSLKNLKELDDAFNRKQKMLVPLLASWGYTGPQAAKSARKSGYAVLRQSDAIALMNAWTPP